VETYATPTSLRIGWLFMVIAYTTSSKRRKQIPLRPAAHRYDYNGLRLLVAVCRELQRVSGQGEFFLSCRTAGKLLGVNHVTAARYLFSSRTTTSSKRSKRAIRQDCARQDTDIMPIDTSPNKNPRRISTREEFF
jgi:hypothetical protein